MDLFSLTDSAVDAINQNERVQVQGSTGFTIGAGRKQVPSYAAAVAGYAQIQALDGSDLKQLDGLNISGDIKAIYLRGALVGVVRPDGKGGDIVTRADGSTWLVVKVIEQWPSWTKAVIVKQES